MGINQENILITGATSFLGRAFLKNKKIANTSLLIRSSSNREGLETFPCYCWDDLDWQNLFKNVQIDTILHLATNQSRRPEDRDQVFHVNDTLSRDLLELALINNVKTFVNIGTCLPDQLDQYTQSKARFRDFLFSKVGEIQVIQINLEHFIHDNPKQFVPTLVRQLIANQRAIDVTEGIHRRDFIDISDTVNAIDHILKSLDQILSGAIFNVGRGQAQSIRSIIELLVKLTNSSSQINWGAIPLREQEPLEIEMDISSLKNLGWQPKLTIEQAFIKLIKQIKEN